MQRFEWNMVTKTSLSNREHKSFFLYFWRKIGKQAKGLLHGMGN